MSNPYLNSSRALRAAAVIAVVAAALFMHGQASARRRQDGKGAGVRAGDGGKRLALVVGNAAYTRKPLNNPVNDARAMARALRESGFEVMTGFDLSRAGLEEAILRFGERLKAEKGLGLFYYSGHGAQVDGENYLLPVEFDIDKVPDRRLLRNYATSVDLVLGHMEVADNRFNVVILDACRDNPFEKGWKGAGSAGLASIEAPSGTLIAYATAPNRTAADGSGALSPYTASLVEQLKVEGQSIYEVFSNVGEEVEATTGRKQRPWIASSLRGRPFCFRGCGRTPAHTDSDASSATDDPADDDDEPPPPRVKRRTSGAAKVDFNHKNEGPFVVLKFGEKDYEFTTYWSEANSRMCYLYIYGVASMAEVPSGTRVSDSADASRVPLTKYRAEFMSEGNRAVVKNTHGKYALITILTINYSGDDKEVTFGYEILPE